MRDRAILLSLLLSTGGCTTHEGDDQETPSAAATTDSQVPAPKKPTGLEPYMPRTPLPPMTVSVGPFECPPLPDSVAGESVEIARVLRQLACQPELFTLAEADVAAKLELPTRMTFGFGDPRTAGISIPEGEAYPSPAELAAALGIVEPVARRDARGYWWLDSKLDTGGLERYGPGEIRIRLDPPMEDDQPLEVVIPLPAELDTWSVSVRMPGHALHLGPDLEGLTQAATAMKLLAANPLRLSEEPDVLIKRLMLTGERFMPAGVINTSTGVRMTGFSFWIKRTELRTDALLEAVGLVDGGSLSIERRYNLWHLKSGSDEMIPWNGVLLQMEVEPLDPEDVDQPLTVANSNVTSVVLLKPPA